MKIDKLISGSLLSLILMLFFASTSFGQSSLKLGNRSFKKGEYRMAVKHYNDYLRKYSDRDVFLKRGISNYHCGRYEFAIEDLENSRFLGKFDNRIDKYLALTYHEKQDFEKAIIHYKKFLAKFRGSRKERNKIVDNIKRCANGVFLKNKRTTHFIENCGSDVNSKLDEILPIQSPNDSSVFYFASNRDYAEEEIQAYDELKVGYIDNNWKQLPLITSEKKAEESTIFLDFLKQGTDALVFSGSYLNSGVYYKYGRANKNSENIVKEKINNPFLDEYGFSYVQFVNDSTIVFSSNKKGGYGGYDIYISGYRNGHWFKPINLGRNINTKFDEISPYMTPDAQNIYYSSNGLKSTGGFDILHAQFSYVEDDWLEPTNLGLPINSPFDEYGYRFLKSRKGGIFNSNRKDLGMGGQDIYWVYYKRLIPISNSYSNEVPCLKHKPLVAVIDTKEKKNKKDITRIEIEKDKGKNNIEKKKINTEENRNVPDIDSKNVDSKTTSAKNKITDVSKPKSKNDPISVFSEGDNLAETRKENIKENDPNSVYEQMKIKQNTVIDKDLNNEIDSTKEKIAEEVIVPIIFTDSDGIKDKKAAYSFLDELGQLMQKYPDLKVEIVGNSFKKGGEGVDIMNSVSIAKNFADSLSLRMIGKGRIIVRGVGDNFPVVNPNGSKMSKDTIAKYNNRLDIYLHNYKDVPIAVKYEPLPISRKIRDGRCELYRANLMGLSYKILVNTGDFLFYDRLLNEYPDSWIEIDEKHKKYCYTVGIYQSYVSAKVVYNEILREGNKGIKIIPYIDGIRVTRKEALAYAKIYSDLVNYLENTDWK